MVCVEIARIKTSNSPISGVSTGMALHACSDGGEGLLGIEAADRARHLLEMTWPFFEGVVRGNTMVGDTYTRHGLGSVSLTSGGENVLRSVEIGLAEPSLSPAIGKSFSNYSRLRIGLFLEAGVLSDVQKTVGEYLRDTADIMRGMVNDGDIPACVSIGRIFADSHRVTPVLLGDLAEVSLDLYACSDEKTGLPPEAFDRTSELIEMAGQTLTKFRSGPPPVQDAEGKIRYITAMGDSELTVWDNAGVRGMADGLLISMRGENGEFGPVMRIGTAQGKIGKNSDLFQEAVYREIEKAVVRNLGPKSGVGTIIGR